MAADGFGRFFSQKSLVWGIIFPQFNGLIFILLIALSAALLVNTLKINRRQSAAFLGCLMSRFPRFARLWRSVTWRPISVFPFSFPFWGPGAQNGGNSAFRFRPSVLPAPWESIQAYVPVSIGIFLLLLMKGFPGGECKALFSGAQGGFLLRLPLILGAALYFVGLKICLAAYSGTVLDTYQGSAPWAS